MYSNAGGRMHSASLFSVQPKFMNVDLRIVLDVTVGLADVIVTPDNQLLRYSSTKLFSDYWTEPFDITEYSSEFCQK